jgi:hypothetical protein
VGSRASLDGCGKSFTDRDWIPDRLDSNVSLFRLSYPGSPFPEVLKEYVAFKFDISKVKIGLRTLKDEGDAVLRKVGNK